MPANERPGRLAMNMPSLTRAPSRNRPAATPRYARNRFEIAMGSFALLYLLLFSGVPLVYNVVLSFQQVDLMLSLIHI